MSKDKKDFSKVAAKIIKTPLENFVEDSYLPYAHYVIMSRALISDDGLKPVQRRILYAMNQLNLTDKKDHMKAAQIVGETMGKYHPHGDSSIGEALARLGQDFSMRVPLIDVHGSVGFTTGDDPAAPRYWEGRPTAAAMELTKELSQGAAEMGLNYDGKFPEPTMLPVKWPVGIINGSQGIAVGYSSNVIPHNPTEVMNAVIATIKNPDITTDEIMEIMPGPDMATGGTLVSYEGIKEYYETGKGTFAIRGKYEIVPGARGTHQAVFSEAPYQVSAEQVVRAVDRGKKNQGRFKEVSFVKDLSDIDNGFKLSVGIKAGANPEVVLEDIFRWTPLEQKFSANMNVLKYGVPRVSSMKQLLNDFVEFRKESIVNKIDFRLDYLDKNIERLTGIIAVLVDIDKAISIIRKSDEAKDANLKLQKQFKINEEQASYILSMPLRRLTKSDSVSINEEVKEYKEEHEYLNTLLKDNKAFDEHMIKELEETREIIGDERRTTITHKTAAQLKAEAKAIKKAAARDAQNKYCYVTLFGNDTITRTEEPYEQEGSPTSVITQVRVKTQENLIFVGSDGSARKVPALHVPEDTIMDVSVTTGLREGTVVGLGKEEFDKTSHGILLITTGGGVNVVDGGFPVGDDFDIVNLDDDEEVLLALWLEKERNEKESLFMISSDGYIINFPVEQVRTSNSGAGTVRGMNLNENADVVGASVSDGKEGEVISCSYQTIKTTDVKEIPDRNRNAKGVILQRLSKEDEILTAFVSDRVVGNKEGKSLRFPKANERATSGTKRSGNGVSLGYHTIKEY